jgi:dephospho-CoA kinase
MGNIESDNKLLILAVVGMPGSGKSEVLKTLVKEYNFSHLYYGDITFDEMKRQGLEVNEKNERFVREGLRASGDMGIYSKMILPKIEQEIQQGANKIILESMYNVHEFEVIKDRYKDSFKVLAIHSDRGIRIKRLNSRPDRKLTEEELTSREISEAKNLWKGTLIAMADYHFLNNGSDMAKFEADLRKLLEEKLHLQQAAK